MKTLIVVIITSVLLISCSGKIDSNEFKISGELTGDYRGFIYLGQGNDILDSCLIENNRFTLKGAVDKPKSAYFRLEYRSNIKHFQLENSEISLKGKASTKQLKSGILNELSIDTLIGSHSQLLFEEVMSFFKHYHNVDTTIESKNELLYQQLKKFVQANPDHYVSGWAIGQLNSFEAKKIIELSELIDTTHQQKGDLNNIEKLIRRGKVLALGNQFNNFSHPDTSNNLIHTEALKGTIVLYEFWASWCGPCRGKNPELNKIQEKFNRNDFLIVGVSLDTNRDKWIRAIQKDSTNWIHLSDLKGWKNQLVEEYGITMIPFNFLVDKNGKVVGINLPTQQIEIWVEELL
ncbi:MAG: AhpC/TSA family protein [Bacteroidetes bacterium]|nr:MAG: AhpC/TSA family protein [Bacteroidota bacterium]